MFKILSKDGCKMCEDAKNLLDNNDISYEILKVDRDELNRLCGRNVPSYPQILRNNKHFGDIFDLEDYIDNEYEPILAENKNRFTVFPLKHHNLWELYKKVQMSNWTAEEIDLSSDLSDWKKLSENEKHFIKRSVAL